MQWHFSPQRLGMWFLCENPQKLWSSRYTLWKVCSHLGSWEIGSGQHLCVFLHRKWLHKKKQQTHEIASFSVGKAHSRCTFLIKSVSVSLAIQRQHPSHGRFYKSSISSYDSVSYFAVLMSSEGELTGTENSYKFVLFILLLTFISAWNLLPALKTKKSWGGGCGRGRICKSNPATRWQY